MKNLCDEFAGLICAHRNLRFDRAKGVIFANGIAHIYYLCPTCGEEVVRDITLMELPEYLERW